MIGEASVPSHSDKTLQLTAFPDNGQYKYGRCICLCARCMVYGCNTCVNRFGYDCMTFPIDDTLISSPIIGGVFSSPAVRWPSTLGKLSYLRDHPYFLPCFIPSVLAFIAFLVALFGLKEVFTTVSYFFHFSNYVQTLPSAVLQQKHRKEKPSDYRSTSSTSLLEDRDAFHYRSIEDNTQHCISSWQKSEISQPPPLRALLTPRVLAVAINQGFVCFCDISMQVLMPLMWSTSLEHGGLGFTPYTIGLTLGIFGVVNVVIQVMLLGKLIRRFGPRKVLIFSFPAFLVSLACFPLEGCLARQMGGVDWRVWTVIIVHLVMDSLKYYCYGELNSLIDGRPNSISSSGALQILITDSAPCQSALGSVSGFAQALGCVAKSLAPSVASSLFAISLQRNWVGGDAVHYILMAVVACGIPFSFLLPKALQVQTNPYFEDTPDY